MRIICLLAGLALVGCVSQADVGSWVGAHYDDLVINLGSPRQVTPLSDGGALVEFYRADTTGIYSYSDGNGGTQVGGGNTYTCTAYFVIDNNGYVVSGKSNGLRGPCKRLVPKRN